MYSCFEKFSLKFIPSEPPPSLLTVILDTNPHAWTLLAPTLPLSQAIANLLVFINAHLAFNNANKVSIIASHTQKAEFLYPTTPPATTNGTNGTAQNGTDEDTIMASRSPSPSAADPPSDANHYRPFQTIQRTLLLALQRLLDNTSSDSLTPTTSIAGALTLALTYINKQQILSSSPSSKHATNDPSTTTSTQPIAARILILSVSGDLAHQYIPIMNTVFACQRSSIPIDICKIAGDTVFLQQASDATKGTYIKLEKPQGLLQYLMMGFLADQTNRKMLLQPTGAKLDFRAACFCHRRVVDIGFVCSICLSSKCATFLLPSYRTKSSAHLANS